MPDVREPPHRAGVELVERAHARGVVRGEEDPVRRDFEHWREAFFTPAQVGGIVVQLGELAKNGPGTDEAFV